MNTATKDETLRELAALAAGPQYASSSDYRKALAEARVWKGIVLGATSTALGESHPVVREIRQVAILHTGETRKISVTGPYVFRLEGDEEIKGLLERAIREVRRAHVSDEIVAWGTYGVGPTGCRSDSKLS